MPKPIRPTLKQHRAKYGSCTECELCQTRNRIVLGRGGVPCDVMFIGEAPGTSENALGKAFIGPAGKLLDDMIASSKIHLEWEYREFFSNLIACIPLDDAGSKVKQPPKKAIKACRGRLDHLVKVARPKAIVRVGKVSTANYEHKTLPMCDIIHPAAILRADVTQKQMAIQQTVLKLVDFLEELSNAQAS